MIEISAPMMIVLCALMLSALVAMIRVFLGPTAPDRVVGVDTINTIVVSGMLLFGAATRQVIFVDVAIIYALLSFVATLYIAKYLEGGKF